MFESICKTFFSLHHIFLPLYALWANFDFLSRPHARLYLCSLMHTTSKGSPIFPHWCGVLYTVLHLLGIFNRSSFYQCHTEFMVSLECDSNSEVVRIAAEFVGDKSDLWVNDWAICPVCSRVVASPRLHNRINECLLYGLVGRVPGYRSRGLGSIPIATRFSEK
jgi:hypothetical protein